MENKILLILSQEMSVLHQRGTHGGNALGTGDIVTQNFPSTQNCPLWQSQFVPISPCMLLWLDLFTQK